MLNAIGVDWARFFWTASRAPFCLFCSRRKRSLYRFTSSGSSSPLTSCITARISLMPDRPVAGTAVPAGLTEAISWGVRVMLMRSF